MTTTIAKHEVIHKNNSCRYHHIQIFYIYNCNSHHIYYIKFTSYMVWKNVSKNLHWYCTIFRQNGSPFIHCHTQRQIQVFAGFSQTPRDSHHFSRFLHFVWQCRSMTEITWTVPSCAYGYSATLECMQRSGRRRRRHKEFHWKVPSTKLRQSCADKRTVLDIDRTATVATSHLQPSRKAARLEFRQNNVTCRGAQSA